MLFVCYILGFPHPKRLVLVELLPFLSWCGLNPEWVTPEWVLVLVVVVLVVVLVVLAVVSSPEHNLTKLSFGHGTLP